VFSSVVVIVNLKELIIFFGEVLNSLDISFLFKIRIVEWKG